MKTILILSSMSAVLALASCSKDETATSNPPAGAESPAATPYPLEVCLVSGEELGSMGEPHVIVHEGQEIRFCCEQCEPKFKANPEKYLSQLTNP